MIVTHISKSMMVIATKWDESPSFRMIPTTENCPYIDVVYDSIGKNLVVLSKEFKEKPQILVRLDNKGLPSTIHNKNGQQMYAEERVIMDAYYEYYIIDPEDIREFIKIFAINPEHPAVEAGFTYVKPVAPTPVHEVNVLPEEVTVTQDDK